MNKELSVIFLGTPDFAVASLKALLDAGVRIVAVVTAPDKPAGRGMKLQQSAVKQFAVTKNIPVLQPVKLKSPEFINELKSYQADLQVVIAFRMLPEVVWSMPRLGTINLHASLLPDYRGAAPINWAIINGETKTGVSTFLLKHEIDTGDIIQKQEVDITPTMNAGELHDLLMHVGADVMVKTVQAVAENNYSPIPQKSDSQKHAPKLFTADCKIDWSKPGIEIYNKIRGLNPYPGAFTEVNRSILKIYESVFEPGMHNLNIGMIETEHGKNPYIRFAVQNGWIYAITVQLEGKKRMKVEELLRGWRV
ncbi:MAG: methionyl-tRNA formyltransferase [Bacteroidota bacterium]